MNWAWGTVEKTIPSTKNRTEKNFFPAFLTLHLFQSLINNLTPSITHTPHCFKSHITPYFPVTHSPHFLHHTELPFPPPLKSQPFTSLDSTFRPSTSLTTYSFISVPPFPHSYHFAHSTHHVWSPFILTTYPGFLQHVLFSLWRWKSRSPDGLWAVYSMEFPCTTPITLPGGNDTSTCWRGREGLGGQAGKHMSYLFKRLSRVERGGWRRRRSRNVLLISKVVCWYVWQLKVTEISMKAQDGRLWWCGHVQGRYKESDDGCSIKTGVPDIRRRDGKSQKRWKGSLG